MRARRPISSGKRVELHRPRPADAPEFCAGVRASDDLHHPWLSAPRDRETFLAYLDRVQRPTCSGYVVRLVGAGDLVGFVNVNDIVVGAQRSASIGYGAFVPHDGAGLLTEAVGLALDEAFGPLGLHRIEANVQPGNDRSLALVRRLGFRLEGYSPRLLHVDGDWRDHLRWAIVADEWLARPAPNGA
jgi:ribosomal-protein-alanine N-acetyltransferase